MTVTNDDRFMRFTNTIVKALKFLLPKTFDDNKMVRDALAPSFTEIIGNSDPCVPLP